MIPCAILYADYLAQVAATNTQWKADEETYINILLKHKPGCRLEMQTIAGRDVICFKGLSVSPDYEVGYARLYEQLIADLGKGEKDFSRLERFPRDGRPIE